MSSAGGQAAAVNTGAAAPFNVTGVTPASTIGPVGDSSFAVGNVKRVWGSATVEEEKAPEPSPS